MFLLITTPGASAPRRRPLSSPFPFCRLQSRQGGGLRVLFASAGSVPAQRGWVPRRTAEEMPHQPNHPLLRMKPVSPGWVTHVALGTTMGSRMPGILPARCNLGFIIPFSLCPPPQNCPPHQASCCTLTFMGWQLRRSVRFEMLLLKSPMAGEGNIYLQLDIY